MGTHKAPLSVIPWPVVYEAGLGMLDGSLKYGRHNYRVVGVRGSVYFDATMRHLSAWWEGEDIDADSGLSHVTKAISSLMVLRDAMLSNKLSDDRPPVTHDGFIQEYNARAKALIEATEKPVPPYTQENTTT